MSEQKKEYVIYHKCSKGGYLTIKNKKVNRNPAKWYKHLTGDVKHRYLLLKGYEATKEGIETTLISGVSS